jgi:polyvinyl alcohol dehydrogenase (cytochrome)
MSGCHLLLSARISISGLPQIFDATVNWQTSKLVGLGQKNGYYWAFDRTTGKPVWSTFVGYANIGGGIRGSASVNSGRILVWSNNSYIDGKDPIKFPLTVKALDAATGANLWTDDKAQPANGAAAGYLANDVFFVGSLDGTIQGYSATDGKTVFKDKLPGAVGSSPVVDNDSVYVGVGVPKDNSGSSGQSGLFVFKLKSNQGK